MPRPIVRPRRADVARWRRLSQSKHRELRDSARGRLLQHGLEPPADPADVAVLTRAGSLGDDQAGGGRS